MKSLITLKSTLEKYFYKILDFIINKWPRSVFYIGGNDTLPPPLSLKEELRFVHELQNGDNTVRSILIERERKKKKKKSSIGSIHS